MLACIRAEYLKLNRTFTKKMIWMAPLLNMPLCFGLMGGRFFQTASYNWWYFVLLPGAGFIFLLREPVLDLGFYLKAGFLLFGCCLFPYALHVFVSLGKVASIGLGITGSLTAALLLTGLGDRIWGFVPCAWAARMVTHWALGNLTGAVAPDSHLATAALCCTVGTAAIFILLGCWFRRWEGRIKSFSVSLCQSFKR